MLASKRKRHLGVENLEGRALLAGDVSVDVVNGNLIIRGDEADNSISIAAGAEAGAYVVTGLATAGGDTTINGGPETVFNASGVTGDIDVRLRDGDDTLAIGAINVADDLKISMGQGDDTVTLETGVSVAGELSIKTDGGDDSITATGVTVQESAHINAGTGNDTVSLTDLLVENVEDGEEDGESLGERRGFGRFGDFFEDLFGGGWKGHSHEEGDHEEGYVEVDLGSGDDTLTVSGLTATKFKVYGGNGDDDAMLSGLVVDRLHADLGRGDDSLAVSASTIDRMMAKLGDGDDELSLAADVNISASLSIDGGRGTDSLIDNLAVDPLDLTRRRFESIV
jgi:hypothetical protein